MPEVDGSPRELAPLDGTVLPHHAGDRHLSEEQAGEEGSECVDTPCEAEAGWTCLGSPRFP